jgi:hypothetical protein
MYDTEREKIYTASNDMGHFIIKGIPNQVFNYIKDNYYYEIYSVINGYGIRKYMCRERAYPLLNIEVDGVSYTIDNKYMKGDLIKYLKDPRCTVKLNNNIIKYNIIINR